MASPLPKDMIQEREERAMVALTPEGPGKDLADLTDAEFNAGLERLQTVQRRIRRLLETALVEGGHYGNPKDSRGRVAFKKPILYKAGAEELRRLLRYTLRRVEPDEVTIQAPSADDTFGFVSVVVLLGIYDATGRLLAVRAAACNTKEPRFRKYDGSGWIYQDAREQLHNCIAMAEKRAGALLTCEASGATAFLANEEAMAEALDEDKAMAPWTDGERTLVRQAAGRKGIGRRAFEELVHRTLGRDQIGTGPDVLSLLEAIEKYQPAESSAEQVGDS